MLSYEEQEFEVAIDGRKLVVKISLDQGYLMISWDALLTPMQVLQLINRIVARISAMILNNQILHQYQTSRESIKKEVALLGTSAELYALDSEASSSPSATLSKLAELSDDV